MDNIFEEMDFGLLKPYLDNDDVTDISYSNNGQLWLKTLSHGIFRVADHGIDNALWKSWRFNVQMLWVKVLMQRIHSWIVRVLSYV